MCLLFTSTTIAFVLLIIIFLVIISLTYAMGGVWGGVLCVSLYTNLFVLVLGLQFYARRKYKRIIESTLYNCKIKEYINICKKLSKKKVPRLVKKSVLINLSKAYLLSGDYDSAKKVVCDYAVDIKSDTIYEVLYLDFMTSYYLRMNDLKNAIIVCEKYQAKLKSKLTERETFIRAYIGSKFLIRMKQGDFDGAETFYKETLLTAEYILQKVQCNYYLGQIALHYHKSKEAKEAFTYVISNGGDTYYAQYAQEYLNQI